MSPRLPLIALLIAATPAQAGQIERHVAMTPGAPVLVAATVPAGAPLTFFSGKLPASGDTTEAQAANIFDKLDKSLAKIGLGLRDIVRITVYLVAPPGQSRPDYEGFDGAYHARFGTAAQPEIVAQSIVQVAGLRDPHHLVAIDIVAAGKTTISSPPSH